MLVRARVEDHLTVVLQLLRPRARPEALAEAELAHAAVKYGLPDRFVLFVGSVEPRKNLRLLVRSMARLLRDDPECQLVIVGEAAPGGEKASPASGANATGASRCLIFIPVSRNALVFIMQVSTSYLLPSY